MVGFWRGPFSGLQNASFSLYLHMVRQGKLALWSLPVRALIPLMRAPPSWPNYLPKAPPPNTITLGISFQPMILGWGREGGHKHSAHNDCLKHFWCFPTGLREKCKLLSGTYKAYLFGLLSYYSFSSYSGLHFVSQAYRAFSCLRALNKTSPLQNGAST